MHLHHVTLSLAHSLCPPSEPCVYLYGKPSILILYISKEAWTPNLPNPLRVCVSTYVPLCRWVCIGPGTELFYAFPNLIILGCPMNQACSMIKRKKVVITDKESWKKWLQSNYSFKDSCIRSNLIPAINNAVKFSLFAPMHWPETTTHAKHICSDKLHFTKKINPAKPGSMKTTIKSTKALIQEYFIC